MSGRYSKGLQELKEHFQHSVEDYRQSLKACKDWAKKTNKGVTWLGQVPYFVKLQNMEYNLSGKFRKKCEKRVDTYLNELGGYLKQKEKDLKSNLKNLVEDKTKKWDITNESVSSEVSVLEHQGLSKDVPFSEDDVQSGERKSLVDQTSKVEKITPRKTYSRELEKLIERRNTYDSQIKKNSEKFKPKVYLLPDTPAWSSLRRLLKTVQNKDTILFSIDIEAFEDVQSVITEIGISIYDPRENQGTLTPQFRNYHICPSESLSLINTKYIPNHKENYLHGETLVMPLVVCVEFIQGLINYYLFTQSKKSKIKGAIVGHNVKGDLKWLRAIHVKLPPVVNESSKEYGIQTLDTSLMYQMFYGNNGCSLGKALRLHGIPHSYLHNAGNDAHYTLQLLLNMCDIDKRRFSKWDDLDVVERTLNKWKIYDTYDLSSPKIFFKPDEPISHKNPLLLSCHRTLRHRNTSFKGMTYHNSIDSFLEHNLLLKTY